MLPDVRGLYRFYEELALRFAERGLAAVAIDYFGRTAGVGKRDDDFEYMEHVAQTTPEGIQADVAAAVEYLRSPSGGSCTCGLHRRLLLRRPQLVALGRGRARPRRRGRLLRQPGPAQRPAGPTQLAGQIEAPILALQAGDDENITRELNAEFDEALSAAGVEHEIVTYDGAPHSFFDRRYEEYADASANAWSRVLAFIENHSDGD